MTERLREGSDVTAYVCGDLVTLALELHERLAAQGIGVQVVNVPTLKPLPPEEIIRHGRSTRAAITIEEHNIIGGLGSAVAEIYAEGLPRPLRRIGIRDTFTESDDRPVLLRAYGVSLAARRARGTRAPGRNGLTRRQALSRVGFIGCGRHATKMLR